MVRLGLWSILTCAGMFALGVPAPSQDKDGKDDVVGTIWSYELTDGKTEQHGQFRVYKHEMFKGAKKVGLVQPKGDTETTLVFTDYEPFHGKAVLRKVGRKPAVWKGTLAKSDGTKWQMKVTVKDK